MSNPEQPKGTPKNIASLGDLKMKVEQLEHREDLSPDQERVAVLAGTLEHLADLNNSIRTDEADPAILAVANPPTYETLS